MEIKRPLALVLPGGGFRGAYQSGVVMELAVQNIFFDVVAGASIGACNGAAMVLGITEQLPEYWQKAINLNVIQLDRLLLGKSPFKFFDVLKFFADEHNKVDQRDPASLETDLLMSVTELETLSNVIFSFKDPNWDREEKVLQYLASTTLPFLFDPIEIRGRKYLDGGITNNCPIDAAIQWGAREVWVVKLGGYSTLDKIMFGNLHRFTSLWPNPRSSSLRLLQKMFSPNPPVIETATVKFIAPSIPLRLGSVSFTKKRIFQAMELGKKDAQKFLASF